MQGREAVEHGIAAIGRVIVAAAPDHGHRVRGVHPHVDRISKEFGLLLAVAILTDALVVKMTLVPSFLTLMGEKSYIPRWLDRLLPDITIEPPHDGGAPVAERREFPAEPKPNQGPERFSGSCPARSQLGSEAPASAKAAPTTPAATSVGRPPAGARAAPPPPARTSTASLRRGACQQDGDAGDRADGGRPGTAEECLRVVVVPQGVEAARPEQDEGEGRREGDERRRACAALQLRS